MGSQMLNYLKGTELEVFPVDTAGKRQKVLLMCQSIQT